MQPWVLVICACGPGLACLCLCTPLFLVLLPSPFLPSPRHVPSCVLPLTVPRLSLTGSSSPWPATCRRIVPPCARPLPGSRHAGPAPALPAHEQPQHRQRPLLQVRTATWLPMLCACSWPHTGQGRATACGRGLPGRRELVPPACLPLLLTLPCPVSPPPLPPAGRCMRYWAARSCTAPPRHPCSSACCSR